MGARKKLALEQFNRDNILTAARELFETKGVQDTTMTLIFPVISGYSLISGV